MLLKFIAVLALTFCKLILEVCVADGFGSLAHLSDELLQPPHATDHTSLKHVRHLADLSKRRTLQRKGGRRGEGGRRGRVIFSGRRQRDPRTELHACTTSMR